MNISITLIIVIMTSLVSWQAFNNPEMKAKFLFRPVDIARGEYHRWLTGGFIHADLIHLMVNMYVLYTFGEYVEQLFIKVLFGELWGRMAYIAFYLLAIVVAGIPTYFRHKDNFAYSALGASGATSAVIFAFIITNPWAGLTLLILPFFSIPALFLGIVYLIYSNYMDKKGIDNIGHNAHFTGAVFGVVFIIGAALLMNPFYFQHMLQQIAMGPWAQ
ncbi:MAG: rhomboid family intramembrane serine protease [Saprospiraceae bacterium]